MRKDAPGQESFKSLCIKMSSSKERTSLVRTVLPLHRWSKVGVSACFVSPAKRIFRFRSCATSRLTTMSAIPYPDSPVLGHADHRPGAPRHVTEFLPSMIRTYSGITISPMTTIGRKGGRFAIYFREGNHKVIYRTAGGKFEEYDILTDAAVKPSKRAVKLWRRLRIMTHRA